MGDNRIGDIHLKFLQTHYLFFQSPAGDKSVYIHHLINLEETALFAMMNVNRKKCGIFSPTYAPESAQYDEPCPSPARPSSGSSRAP
jgi:hypothetical protein